MYTALTTKIVKIAKPHICHGCDRRYSVGQLMKYSTGINDGDFHASYWCPICDEYMNTDSFDWDNYPEGICEGDLMEEYQYRSFRSKFKPVIIVHI